MKYASNESPKEVLRIALIDFYADGHHTSYLNYLAVGLARCGASVLVLSPVQLENFEFPIMYIKLSGAEQLSHLNGVRRQMACLRLSRKALAEATEWNATHIHFVYADWHLSAIAIAWFLAPSSAALALTIHWVTGAGVDADSRFNSMRRYPHRVALCWLSRRAAHIFVHHNEVAASLRKMLSTRDIDVIPYPSEPLPKISPQAREAFRAEIGVSNDEILLLCFGGTRLDKGADLAIECLARLPERFHLLIAGQPVQFDCSDLLRVAINASVKERVHLVLRYIEDDEVAVMFHSCDMVLLPYRRTFSGQSGPLMQGASTCRAIVSADLPVLGNTVREFALGETFKPDDIDDMVFAIRAGAEWQPTKKFTEAFIKHHAPSQFASIVYNVLLRPAFTLRP